MNPALLDIPDQLSTHRLLLRRYRPGDGAAYFRTVRASASHLYEFLPPELASLQDEADAERWIDQARAGWQGRQLFLFGLWTKESGAYIGEAYLANPDWRVPCIELGYFLGQAHTGSGYATEASREIIRFAFEHLAVARVELECAADNRASMKVAERCGFQLEGRLRRRHPRKDGTCVDRLWYGLLEPEWRAAPGDGQ